MKVAEKELKVMNAFERKLKLFLVSISYLIIRHQLTIIKHHLSVGDETVIVRKRFAIETETKG